MNNVSLKIAQEINSFLLRSIKLAGYFVSFWLVDLVGKNEDDFASSFRLWKFD